MKVNDIVNESWNPDKEYPDTEQGAIECFTEISEYKPEEITKVYPDPYTDYVWAIHTNTKRYGPQKHVVWLQDQDFATDDRSGEEDFKVMESTTSGSIATVSVPLSTQKREGVGKGVYDTTKPGNLLTGKASKKKYANSLHEDTRDSYRIQVTTDDGEVFTYSVRADNEQQALNKVWHRANKSGYDDFELKVLRENKPLKEGKMKELAIDIRDMDNGNFKKKYGKSKEQMKFNLGDPEEKKTVHEAHLEEEDKIIAPGKGKKLKTGLYKPGQEKKLSHFKHPFKSSGVHISDSRGNKVGECENEDIAKEVTKALNEYVKIDENIKRVGAYNTKAGILKLLKSGHDPMQYFLINPKGEVVKQFRGTEDEVKRQVQQDINSTIVHENRRKK